VSRFDAEERVALVREEYLGPARNPVVRKIGDLPLALEEAVSS